LPSVYYESLKSHGKEQQNVKIMKILGIFCPTRLTHQESPFPHHGLAIIGAHLIKAGFQFAYVDYAYHKETPPLDEVIADYKPDWIAISVFTANATESQNTCRLLAEKFDLPIVVGGPHATLFSEEVSSWPGVKCVFSGEAELELVTYFQNWDASLPIIIHCSPPPLEEVEFPAYHTLLYGPSPLRTLAVQLSRGCPFNCSFCNIRLIATKNLRHYPVDKQLARIQNFIARFPEVETVRIVDDCPGLPPARFKLFLHKFAAACPRQKIYVDNLRADSLDEELVDLLKRCRIDHICFGVESADSDVFAAVQKGESLAEIEKAIQLVQKASVPLFLCFVLGLPKATAATDRKSIEFAKRIKPDWVYWNVCTPWPGTKVFEWFQEHGHMDNLCDTTSLCGYGLDGLTITCETEDYPVSARIQILYAAVLETGSYHAHNVTRKRVDEISLEWGLDRTSILQIYDEKVRNLHSGFLEGYPTDPESLANLFLHLYPHSPSLAMWRFEEIFSYGSRRHFNGLTLDLGCGDGVFFHTFFNADKVIGIDVNKAILGHAKIIDCYKGVFSAAGEEIPFRNETYDYVFSNCVLEHTRAPEKIFLEVHRILKPGGAFLLSVLTQQSQKWFLPSRLLGAFGFQKKAQTILRRFDEWQTHRNVLREENWRALTEKSGLKLLRVRPYMDVKRYTIFSVFDWLWNIRCQENGPRFADKLEPFLSRHSWIRRGLHVLLRVVMQSKRTSTPAAGLVILAYKE
jgi:anaerobic magnesium-protoporphyrin IX monomethyl ester cyclase